MKMLIMGLAVWSFGMQGGITNPHSECDGKSCLDNGTAIGVSAERIWTLNDHLKLRYGFTGWFMDFTEADRETSSDPMENRRGDNDLILTGLLKPSVVWGRISAFPVLGMGIDTDKETYGVLGFGVDVRVYKNLHIEALSTAMRAKCTWHRTSTIGLRYEF